MENAPLRTAPLDFLHFQVFITILSIHSFLLNLLIAFFRK